MKYYNHRAIISPTAKAAPPSSKGDLRSPAANGRDLKKIFLTFISCILCFISCEKSVEIDVPYSGNKLVVNSFFNPDSVITLSLTHSLDLHRRPGFLGVTGATATLLDGQGTKLGDMAYQEKGRYEEEHGIYKSSIKPEPDKIYQIEVSKKGYESVTAKGQVPADSARIVKVEKTLDTTVQLDNNLSLSLWLNDPEGQDFYELYGIQTYEIYAKESDTSFFNERQLSFDSNEAVFQKFELTADVSTGNFLLFPDDLFDGTITKLTLQTHVAYINCSTDSCKNHNYNNVTLYLRKISADYYHYKKTVAEQNKQEKNPFAEPVFVFNNIKNGLGIFAGFQTTEYSFEIQTENQ